MGVIVPAARGAGRVLLVGQAPGADGDVRPLTGTMGLTLARLAGLDGRFPERDPDDQLGVLFDRANVLDEFPGRGSGKGHEFPTVEARAAAAEMWPLLLGYERVLFCGRAVINAFRLAPWGDSLERTSWRTRRSFSWFWDSGVCMEEHAPDTTSVIGAGVRGLACTPHTRSYAAAYALRLAWMPHTSGIVTWWNDAGNRRRAGRFLRELAKVADGR